jgi:hypothetical protein
LTRSISCSLVAFASGCRLRYHLGKLCVFVLGLPLTALNQRLSSVSVHVSGSACSMLDLLSYMESISLPPEGSFSAGNMSPPHMFHNEVKVTIPANPMYSQPRKEKVSNTAQTKEQVLPSCQYMDLKRSIHCIGSVPGTAWRDQLELAFSSTRWISC